MATLTPLQRRIATRFSRLVHDLSGEAIATEIGIASQQTFDDIRFAQLLIQLHLKHVEMRKALITSFRAGLYSPTAALTRPLLEGSSKLCWVVVPGGAAERRARLLRTTPARAAATGIIVFEPALMAAS